MQKWRRINVQTHLTKTDKKVGHLWQIGMAFILQVLNTNFELMMVVI